MNAQDVIQELNCMGVTVVSPSPGKVQLRAHSGNVPAKAVDLARPHRDALAEHLKTPSRCVHLPPFDAIEAPDPRRPGWIKSTCRRCGRHLGCRPASRE